ncbi:helix-turn-helix domain-containing protein [Amycolatopsis jiangsuensis]|uniref:Transcriptional regulator with XRE-family HTH domain n=1 Tax=Amycolatopsis jiangsuensis TaxID=1181879 RepID=A0A840J6N3_9PSEU|nr:Scr1 family TA system antitoxin-like transcriptional regulator [Amycolatopsis jiangsuensis]MBB4689690.1 transcriptional regulator with XRE-family HTH domain [Amycolatopsis jiangsuensis]
MNVEDKGPFRNRLLGIALRAARKHARYGVRELARRIGTNPALISNWELGQRTPKVTDVAGILGALGVVGEEKQRILHLARLTGPGLIVPGNQSHRDHLAALRDCEAMARSIRVWHPLQIPDLLQIPDYSMAALFAQGFLASDVRELATVRAESGNVILGFDATPITAFVGAAALTNLVGTPEIMRRQLEILVVASTGITLRVVPDDVGEHPGRSGPFTLYDTPAATVAYFSHRNAGIFLPDDRNEYRDVIERLDKNAKTPLESVMIIEDIASRFAAFDTT